MSSEGLAIPLSSRRRMTGTVVLRAGESEPFRTEEWRDALVVVQSGSLRVECLSGRTADFDRGSVVCFRGVPLAALRAAGEDVVLLVLRR